MPKLVPREPHKLMGSCHGQRLTLRSQPALAPATQRSACQQLWVWRRFAWAHHARHDAVTLVKTVATSRVGTVSSPGRSWNPDTLGCSAISEEDRRGTYSGGRHAVLYGVEKMRFALPSGLRVRLARR